MREKYYWLAGSWRLVLEQGERKTMFGLEVGVAAEQTYVFSASARPHLVEF